MVKAMAQIIQFPKPTALPIGLPPKEGWLLEFGKPAMKRPAPILPDNLAILYADPDGDIA
jgi:hypothetical protein